MKRCDQVWSRCLPIGDKLPWVIGPRWLHRLRWLHYRDSLGLWNTFPILSHQCSSPSSCWNSSNEGLPQTIEKIDMKAVWALLLLFLSQADTYLGRRGPYRGPALGLKEAVSRQESSGTYSWPWLLGRQTPPRRRPSTLEILRFKLRGLLGFNPRGVKSIKRTLRLPTLRLPTIAPLRLISVAPLRLRCSTFSIIELSESTQMLFSSTFLQCWVRKVTKEIF